MSKTRSLGTGILPICALAVSAFAQGDKTTAQKSIHPLNRAPVNHEVLEIKLPRPTQVKLPNGLTVLLLEQHRVPTVNLALWINSGSLDDPRDQPGLAKFTADMLREGTAKRSSAQLSSEIDELGGALSASVQFGATYTQVSASSLSENSERLFDLFSDVVLNASFPAEEFEKYKQRQLAGLEQQRSEPSFLSQERLFRSLYGDSPASVVSATPASVNAASSEQLKQFHAQHYVPNNAILGVAGDFAAKQMSAVVQKYFGSWKASPSGGAKPPAIPPAGGNRIFLVDRPDSVQTNILAGELAIPENHPDYIPLRVMNRVLGEGAAARLFLNLREDKGYTYGAYSRFQGDTYPRPLLLNTEVRTAVTDGSVHELLGEIKRLQDEPVPDQELDDARRSIVAGFALSLEHQSWLLSLWMQAKHNQLPEDYWDRYPAEIAKVGPDSVERVARKYLNLEHLQLACVGAAKDIKDTLLKYGPVEVYDSDGKKVSP
jgi:zinc protease